MTAAQSSAPVPVAEVSDGPLPLTLHPEGHLAVYRRRPASMAPAVRTLLLHGLASNSAVWEPFVERAAPHLDLWCGDLPWGADPSGAWSLDADVHRWVGRAMAAVDDGVDVVIAHSFAANAVLRLLDAPDAPRVAAVVLLAPFYRGDAGEFDWHDISYYLNSFHRILQEGVRVRSAGRLDEQLELEIALRVRDRIGPYGWMRFFDTYLRTPSLRPSGLTTPFLVVSGADDIAASVADSRALATALPRCRLEVIPGCGHFAMADRPDHFAAVVGGFVDDVRGTSTDHRPSPEQSP